MYHWLYIQGGLPDSASLADFGRQAATEAAATAAASTAAATAAKRSKKADTWLTIRRKATVYVLVLCSIGNRLCYHTEVHGTPLAGFLYFILPIPCPYIYLFYIMF